MSSSVLNPALYRRLQRCYGEGSVDVVSAGYEIDWSVSYAQVVGYSESVPRRVIHQQGEEYRVCCQKCHDHRPRLYINHRWGVWDAETNSYNLWLANCFNENCYNEYEDQRYLFEYVWSLNTRGQSFDAVKAGRVYDLNVLREIPDPGPLVRLDVLVKHHPNHDAITWLTGRGFDPEFLGRNWGVSFCMMSRYRLASNRIIIPIRQNGMQVGWQARYIGDDVNGEPFNDARVPKYWTSPSMPRRLVAYNLNRALTHSTVVIVEGPSDVWNVGPMGIGALGTTLSSHVQSLIYQGMRRFGNDAVVVVMLDPQPEKRNNKKPRPHPIDELSLQLQLKLPGHVVPVWLPQEYDPGSIDRKWMIELIKEKVSEAGLVATFSRPALRPVQLDA